MFAWTISANFKAHQLTRKVDGYLARNFNAKSVLGTILDPAADKLLMTTLAVTLAWNGALPSTLLALQTLSKPRVLLDFASDHQCELTRPVPLAVLIIGRDVLLSLSAFYWRYSTLPEPVRV